MGAKSDGTAPRLNRIQRTQIRTFGGCFALLVLEFPGTVRDYSLIGLRYVAIFEPRPAVLAYAAAPLRSMTAHGHSRSVQFREVKPRVR